MKLHRHTPFESRMGPVGLRVKRSRSHCIDYWKWLMLHNCFPFTPIVMELNTKTPHESGMCSMDVGVKRSRSQCSDYWKWFLAHNCFPFTSAIIKLHAQIPCESRICLTDIGVKNLGSLNWLPRGVFVPLGQPHSSCLYFNFCGTTYGLFVHHPSICLSICFALLEPHCSWELWLV